MRQRSKWVFTFIILYLMGGVSSTLGQSIHIPASILVKNDDRFGLVTFYTVQPKNTLYSVCKFYDCDLSELKKYNKGLDLAIIEPGQTLRIPFKRSILEDVRLNGNHPDYLPVYYKTQQKDNLFRIARIYFKQEISTIKNLNNLSGNDIQPEQLLLVGWKKRAVFNTQEINKGESANEKTAESAAEALNEAGEDRMVFIKKLEPSLLKRPERSDSTRLEVENRTIVQQNGLAIWNKKSRASGSFALHNDAKEGTLLEITNPLLNRKSYVKVIGKIPGNSYPANVKVILSPEAAKALGALDSRFYVRMNYIKG
jgi:LysM repeat protein